VWRELLSKELCMLKAYSIGGSTFSSSGFAITGSANLPVWKSSQPVDLDQKPELPSPSFENDTPTM
jgi:hypothetical protein